MCSVRQKGVETADQPEASKTPSRERQPARAELSDEEGSVVCRGHGGTGLAAFIIASRHMDLREVGIKSLELSPCVCKNNNGIVKAYLHVPLDVMGLRLCPRPSPALVGQPSLGRVALSTPLDALQQGRISTNSPSVFYPATVR
jgi:hypothetical protein